ncbi:hypothetical protein OIDMADRAFT_59923 [Oidiodendron maius Zn]|uniref:Uncharacterized protein n=1 Tax=Oidiodendron maius (strain Zn) TaxID=913774 RepID=A0A0C3D0M0_OIDMZ|nr:hypothetical protein OIDMADRAFT_59923 [Oidiodendron maius Zn]
MGDYILQSLCADPTSYYPFQAQREASEQSRVPRRQISRDSNPYVHLVIAIQGHWVAVQVTISPFVLNTLSSRPSCDASLAAIAKATQAQRARSRAQSSKSLTLATGQSAGITLQASARWINPQTLAPNNARKSRNAYSKLLLHPRAQLQRADT